MGMLLRYPYEVRDASEYFDDIQDVKITKDMLDLAKHIVKQKSGHFEPDKFEDHYEAALQDNSIRNLVHVAGSRSTWCATATGAAGTAGEKTKRPSDRSGPEASTRQRNQSHGCFTG